MAVIINASTSTGLVQSADTSGIIQFQSNGSTKATLNSSGFSYPGAVLQVLQATKTDTFSVTGSDFTDVTGLSISITPSNSSNKILVLIHLHLDSTVGGFTNPWRIMRNSTAIAIGDAAGSRRQVTGTGTSVFTLGPLTGVHQAAMWLDSPSTTSSTTYKIQVATYTNSTGTTYVNRGGSDDDNINHARAASSIIVMEIAA
jgi:hypothetical protein